MKQSATLWKATSQEIITQESSAIVVQVFYDDKPFKLTSVLDRDLSSGFTGLRIENATMVLQLNMENDSREQSEYMLDRNSNWPEWPQIVPTNLAA